MSIKHEEFLNTAKAIAQCSSSLEVDLRNAVSRAYYSAYHACREIIEVHQYEGVGAHESLIRTMIDSGDNALKTMGLQLGKCKVKRVKADYKLNQSILPPETIQVITECEKIREGVTNFAQSSQTKVL